MTAEPPYREDRDPRFTAFRRALVCFTGAVFSDGTKCTDEILGKLYDSALTAGSTIALLKDHDWTVDSIYGYAEQWEKTEDEKLFAVFAVSEQTATEIDEGRFKNVSIAFTVPDYSVEEVSLVAVPQIRGAAFLDAAPDAEAVADDTAKTPAPTEPEKSEEETEQPVEVKNASKRRELDAAIDSINAEVDRRASIAAADTISRLREELKAVRAREARNSRRQELSERTDALIKNGKIAAGKRSEVMAFADTLTDRQIEGFYDLLQGLGVRTFGGPRLSVQTNEKKLEVDSNADLLDRWAKITGREVKK